MSRVATCSPRRHIKKVCQHALVLICCAALVSLGGCAAESKSGLVKEYDDADTVTLAFFGNEMSSAVWSRPFTASDGSRVQVLEDSSLYYGDESGKGDYREILLSRLQADPGSVDFYTIAAEDVISFEQKGYWEDLSSLEAVSTLSQDALEQSSYEGKVFSIPLSYTGFGFFWNVDMLKSYGLSVPTTLDEFLAVCETLKNNGVTPYIGNKGFAITVPAMAAGFAELYASDEKDALLADLSDGTTPVSTYMEKGFAFIEMMRDKGYIDPEFSLQSTPRIDDTEAFLAGEGAFYCSSLGPDLSEASFEVKATGIPVLENGSVSVVGANHRIAINPLSNQKEYAYEAVEYICEPERLATIAQEQGELSALAGGGASYLGSAEADLAKLIQSGNQIPNQDFRLNFNTWIPIRDLGREILSGASAAEAAQAYDAMQEEEIRTYR